MNSLAIITLVNLYRITVAYWVESMGRDADNAAQADYKEKLMTELETFSNQVFSISEESRSELTWIDA